MNDKSNTFGLENQGDLAESAKIDKLINKYGAQKQSKGLAALLKLNDDPVESNHAQFDPLVLNEILRVIREKNQDIEHRFNLLDANVNHLKHFHWQDKKILVSLVTACLVIGVIVGSVFTTPKVENNREPAIIVNKIEKESFAKDELVTKKFVNLRSSNSPKAKKLLTLSPAQVVNVIERKGGWVKVVYHNKLTGVKTSGYVWDEYLTGVRR